MAKVAEGEILFKALKKAKKNGFKISEETEDYFITELADDVPRDRFETSGNYRDLIFSHEFAKAFFGEDEIIFKRQPVREYYEKKRWNTISRVRHIKDWQFHLQMMVLEKEPIYYLENYL